MTVYIRRLETGPERYFDADAFHVWIHEKHGSRRRAADALGSDLHTITRVVLQRSEPKLETYLRWLAAAEMPFGTWLISDAIVPDKTQQEGRRRLF